MSSANSSRFGSVDESGLKDIVDDKDARCTKKATEHGEYFLRFALKRISRLT